MCQPRRAEAREAEGPLLQVEVAHPEEARLEEVHLERLPIPAMILTPARKSFSLTNPSKRKGAT
jgi:hypothetical protein